MDKEVKIIWQRDFEGQLTKYKGIIGVKFKHAKNHMDHKAP